MPRIKMQQVVPVENHLTGVRYQLLPVADMRVGRDAVARVVSICNESDVYEWLFRPRLLGQPYQAEHAEQWWRSSQEGWESGTHFVFAVLGSDGLVAAACDIKSSDPIAEIGYWCSRAHRGVMTNAVRAMCRVGFEAGYHGFFARTRQGNHRSNGVLQRAGFQRRELPKRGYDGWELIPGSPAQSSEAVRDGRSS